MRAIYLDVEAVPLGDGPELLERAGFVVEQAVARTSEEVIAAAQGAVALLVGDTPVAAAALDALPGVRIVSTLTAGTDHVDLAAARARGVWVASVPDATVEEVAVHALAMTLALLRELPAWDRHARSGGWSVAAAGPLRRPSTLTLGLVGLGRTGRRLAALAAPLFGEVVAHDPDVVAAWPAEVRRAGLDEVFAAADVVSLHAPLTPETAGLVDDRRLGLLGPQGRLVNVARGGLVDAPALRRALAAGRLAGAALDVLPDEPPDPADPLLRHPRVLLSPHVGFLSEEAVAERQAKQANNVIAWARAGRPVTVIVEGSSE